MRLTLESTDKIVQLRINGVYVPARVWQGETAEGVRVHAMIAGVAVAKGQPDEVYAAFERDLQECADTRPDGLAIPLRFIL